MGFQPIGPRKLRLAREHTGLDLDRVLRHTNDLWLGRTLKPGGHDHWHINPQTWEVTPDPYVTNTGGHWTSCHELPEEHR